MACGQNIGLATRRKDRGGAVVGIATTRKKTAAFSRLSAHPTRTAARRQIPDESRLADSWRFEWPANEEPIGRSS